MKKHSQISFYKAVPILGLLISIFAALMVWAGFETYSTFKAETEARTQAGFTADLLDSFGNLLRAGLDAETGQRGFIITGNDTYLEPYNSGILVFEETLLNVKQKTENIQTPLQSELFEALDKISRSKFDELAQTITLAKNGREDEALALVNSDVGKIYMDQIRKIIFDLETEERRILDKALNDANQTQSRAIALLRWLALGGLIMGVFMIYFAVGAYRWQKTNDELLQSRSENLDRTQRLLQANKDLDLFAYMAAHDLKAPLKGMDELATWIAEDLGDNLTPEIQKMIDLLRGRVARMEKLLLDILGFSRAGKDMATPEDVDMDVLFNEVAARISPPDGFEIVRDTDMPPLKAPRSAAQLIFLGLLSNAVKHHDRDEGTINIGYKDGGDHHLYYVKDDGPGIPTEYQERVFEIFRKLKPRDEVEGSGMGLSVAKKLVEALGGRIELISEDGKRGAAVNVYIPKLKS